MIGSGTRSGASLVLPSKGLFALSVTVQYCDVASDVNMIKLLRFPNFSHFKNGLHPQLIRYDTS